ncbi:MAG TPA: archaetidylserine decarboxylase [Vicinamibacteria bacterium]|nr:archaetidylserine decarboxylase [Vicinamibacteria bacterium]
MGLDDRVKQLWLRAISRPRLSRLVSGLAESRLPAPLLRPLLRAYVRAYKVDLSEAAEPLAAYPSFNAFFTRRLRAGARSLDPDPGAVLSPCDARVHSIGPVPADGRLEQIKGNTYSLQGLLGGPEAAEFQQGAQATLYLSPSMYHRVHSPVSGRIRSWRYLPGRLYPVNALAVRLVKELFAVNERLAVFIDTEALGPVAVVMVGATNVGRMTLAFDSLATNSGLPATAVRPAQAIPIERGQEIGAFNLGSTVVLLMGRPQGLAARTAPAEVVKMGQALWRPGPTA